MLRSRHGVRRTGSRAPRQRRRPLARTTGLLGVVWLVSVAAGCSSSAPAADTWSALDGAADADVSDAGPPPDLRAWDGGAKGFGQPCSEDAECRSRLCLATRICSKACDDTTDCLPGGNWRCKEFEQVGRRCSCDYRSAREHCNGIDDDCNGEVDDLALCPFSKQCIEGSCQCPEGGTLCPDDVCYDLQTDPDHCGDCKRVCLGTNLPPHAVRACRKGLCGWACEKGWGDCDGKPENGCELELDTDDNCGGCNVVCKNFCASGECCDHPPVVPSCKAGWCTIPAGCFQMGTAGGNECAINYSEFPPPTGYPHPWEYQHPVRLTHPFVIAEMPVTQGQFEGRMGYNPSWYASTDPTDLGHYCGTQTESCSQHPVENLTWYEAAAYCNVLSAEAGLMPCYSCTGSKLATICQEAKGFERAAIYSCPGYRLPTEAEWEYAYRAGTTTSYYNGAAQDPQLCSGPPDPKLQPLLGPPPGWTKPFATYPVGKLQPNGWGLHDLAVSPFEWTNDRVSPYSISIGVPEKDPWGALHSLMSSYRTPGYVEGAMVRGTRAAMRIARFRAWPAAGFRCVRTLSKAP